MQAANTDFRRLRFDSTRLPTQDRDEWLVEVFSRQLLKVDLEPKDGEPLKLDVAVRALPDVAMARGRTSLFRGRHAPGGSDRLVLLMPNSGFVSRRIGDTEVDLGPGMASFYGDDVEGLLDVKTPADMTTFSFSLSKVARLVPGFTRRVARPIPADSEALRLLIAYAEALDKTDAIESPEMQRLVSQHIHDLVALALGAHGDVAHTAVGRGVKAARYHAIRADVLANLTERDLSVGFVAARAGVTPRYVQLLFEAEETTFSAFVLAERLALAYRLLIDPRLMQRKISEIAYDAGFVDAAHFNRAFRRRYGATPSDVRRATAADS